MELGVQVGYNKKKSRGETEQIRLKVREVDEYRVLVDSLRKELVEAKSSSSH